MERRNAYGKRHYLPFMYVIGACGQRKMKRTPFLREVVVKNLYSVLVTIIKGGTV